MTAHRCEYCGSDCDSLPDSDGIYICVECFPVAGIKVKDAPDIIWTTKEMEDLYRNVFGGQTRVPEG